MPANQPVSQMKRMNKWRLRGPGRGTNVDSTADSQFNGEEHVHIIAAKQLSCPVLVRPVPGSSCTQVYLYLYPCVSVCVCVCTLYPWALCPSWHDRQSLGCVLDLNGIEIDFIWTQIIIFYSTFLYPVSKKSIERKSGISGLLLWDFSAKIS